MKMPPADIQSEAALLGSLFLLPPNEARQLLDSLADDDFYHLPHQTVLAACRKTLEEFGAIDAVAVRAELERQGVLQKVGGVRGLMRILDAPTLSTNAPLYYQLVKEAAARRAVFKLRDLAAKAGAPGADLDQTVAAIEQGLERARVPLLRPPSTEDAIKEAEAELERRSKGLTEGVNTGLPRLDRLLRGLRPGQLSCLGGLPGDGKTSFALNIIAHACIELGQPVQMFSAGAADVVLWLARILTQVDYGDIRKGTFAASNYEKWQRAKRQVAAAPLVIDDTPAIAIGELVRRAVGYASRAGRPALVVVDYVQLLKPDKTTKRNLEVAQIVHRLKSLARDLETHVLALSQLRRPSADNPNPAFAWSAAHEQAADILLMLGHRTIYDQAGKAEPPVADRTIKVAKNRHGAVGVVYATFDKPHLTFREKEEKDENTEDTGVNGSGAARKSGQETRARGRTRRKKTETALRQETLGVVEGSGDVPF